MEEEEREHDDEEVVHLHEDVEVLAPAEARQRRHTVSDAMAGWASPLMKEVPRAASGFSTPLSGAFPTTPNFGGSPMASPAQSGSSPGGGVRGEIIAMSCTSIALGNA